MYKIKYTFKTTIDQFEEFLDSENRLTASKHFDFIDCEDALDFIGFKKCHYWEQEDGKGNPEVCVELFLYDEDHIPITGSFEPGSDDEYEEGLCISTGFWDDD